MTTLSLCLLYFEQNKKAKNNSLKNKINPRWFVPRRPPVPLFWCGGRRGRCDAPHSAAPPYRGSAQSPAIWQTPASSFSPAQDSRVNCKFHAILISLVVDQDPVSVINWPPETGTLTFIKDAKKFRKVQFFKIMNDLLGTVAI
jgi:hypothetical protein